MRVTRMACCLSTLLACAATAAASAATWLQDGDAAVSRGEYSAAIRHYTAAADADAASALVYTKRAAAYLATGQLQQALRDLDRALEADASYSAGWLSRGKLHKQRCDVNAAHADFTRVLELRPGHKSAPTELQALDTMQGLLDTLDAALAAGDGAGARAAAQRVLELAPDCARAQVADAHADMLQRNYEMVVSTTGRLLKSLPGNMDALMLRGKAYMYLGDHDLAKRHFGEALKYDPDHKEARQAFNKIKSIDRTVQRATRAAEAGDWPATELACVEGLNLDPMHDRANVGLWMKLCTAYKNQGKHEEALRACDAVLVLDPGRGEASRERVRVLMAAERWDEAVVRAKEVLHAHNNDREAHQLYQEAERGLKLSKRKDYYGILGVTRDASVPDVKRAYKHLARQHHPDKAPPAEREAANARFQEIAEAYEVLSNEEKRGKYDRGEDLDAPGGGGGGGWGPHPGAQQFFYQHGGGHEQHFQFQWG